jgi:hypothetical protein
MAGEFEAEQGGPESAMSRDEVLFWLDDRCGWSCW